MGLLKLFHQSPSVSRQGAAVLAKTTLLVRGEPGLGFVALDPARCLLLYQVVSYSLEA